MSTEVLYPNGYGTDLIMMEEVKRKHGPRMHPEFARRLFNWIEAQNGQVGIGGGWRTKPHPVSAASRAGRSFHQSQTWTDVGEVYAAVDLVARNPGTVHRAPRWSEVIKQGQVQADTWGVHCNVASETWHMQPIEIDGFLNWHWAGRPSLFNNYPIPGATVPPPPSGIPPFLPEQGQFSLWPLNQHKPRIARKAFVTERVEKGYDNWTDRGDVVKYLQGVILHKAGGRIKVDGYYGNESEGRVVDLQNWWNANAPKYPMTVDGLVGPQVWGVIDWLATL